MKKTLSALLICAMAASLAACGNSTATTSTTAAGEAKAETAASNGGGNYILKVNTALSETDPLFVALTDVFKKNVEEKTNGTFRLSCIPVASSAAMRMCWSRRWLEQA